MISWAKISRPAVLSRLCSDRFLPQIRGIRKCEVRVKSQLPFNHISFLKSTPHSACVTDGCWHSSQHTAGVTAGSLQDTFPFSLAPPVGDRCACNAAVAESCSKRQAWVQAAGFDHQTLVSWPRVLWMHHLSELGRQQFLLFQFVFYFIMSLTF